VVEAVRWGGDCTRWVLDQVAHRAIAHGVVQQGPFAGRFQLGRIEIARQSPNAKRAAQGFVVVRFVAALFTQHRQRIRPDRLRLAVQCLDRLVGEAAMVGRAMFGNGAEAAPLWRFGMGGDRLAPEEQLDGPSGDAFQS